VGGGSNIVLQTVVARRDDDNSVLSKAIFMEPDAVEHAQ
jgi:hypothetical protein